MSSAAPGTHIISNATIITVSQRGPPQIATADVEVDTFTSGGRRILSIDCTAADNIPIISGAGAPAQQASSNTDDWMKKDPESMTADELAFFQQVKERGAIIKDEEGEMNLMDVDEKVDHPDDVSQMTKKFKRIGETPSGRPDDDDALGRASAAPDSPDGVLIAYLQQIVHLDLQRPSSERIDTVRIKSPERHHWLALNGLSPKHLTLISCTSEKGELASLDRLEQRWTELETLRLEDISDLLWDNDDWPTTVSPVKAITFAYCSFIRLFKVGGFQNLTKLCIIENDAMATFVRTAENVKGFLKRLEVLYLQSTNGCDARGWADLVRFRDQLKMCTHLKELTLILARANQDTGLHSCIPSSVEILAFHCSCSISMMDDLEDWIKKPADRNWLSNLKSFTFRCDANTFDQLATREEEKWAPFQDVSVPPVAVKGEEGKGDESLDVDQAGDSMDDGDLEARKVLQDDDIEEDDDDDDYHGDDVDADDEPSEEYEDSDDDVMKQDDDEYGQRDVGRREDHNPILLPHVTSMIGNVLNKLKTRNPELQIVA